MPNTVRPHRILAMKREKVYRAFIEPDPMLVCCVELPLNALRGRAVPDPELPFRCPETRA